MKRHDKLKAEHKTPKTEDCYIPGKLLDGIDSKILLDMESGKSFMSQTFYLTVHLFVSLPKFVPNTKNILVGNDQYKGVLFVIPVVINLQEHRSEVHTLVSESDVM